MESLKMSPETRSEIEDRICRGVAGDEDAATLLGHVHYLEAELAKLTKPLEDERLKEIEYSFAFRNWQAGTSSMAAELIAEVKRLRAGEDTRLEVVIMRRKDEQLRQAEAEISRKYATLEFQAETATRGLESVAASNQSLRAEVERLKRHYPILVACALIMSNGKVLLERHAPSVEYGQHQWDIPGGKVEIGETPIVAVVREIREEMAVEIEPVRMLPQLWTSVWTDPDSSKHWVLAVYECRIVSGEPPLSEDLQWLDIDCLDPATVKNPDLDIIRGYAALYPAQPVVRESLTTQTTCKACPHPAHGNERCEHDAPNAQFRCACKGVCVHGKDWFYCAICSPMVKGR